MKPQTFFDHFERLTDAPNTVTRLRELILQLAVQGKLVVQDERDEPAARLLERIEAERKQLVREKKIKEAKLLPPVSEDEKPFEIPDSWRWVRLGDVINYDAARKVSPEDIPEDAWLLELEDIEKDSSRILQRLSFKDRNSLSTKAKFNKDDVLYGKLRPYLNKVVVADADGFCTTEIVALRGYLGIYPNYLMHALKRRDFLDYINSKSYGMKMPRLGTDDARLALFPLPPLEEQKRTVAKVDELMRLCDELERVQNERQESRQHFNRAALDRLLATLDATEFQAHWQTIRDHFPTLTATPDQINKLRQTVLQLAVQGKLTRQDPRDEPAPVLLRRICAERECLVKERRLNRADQLPPVNPDEAPFTLPKGWTWARFPELGEFGRGKSKHRPRNDPSLFNEGKYPLVQTGDVARANGVVTTYTGLYNERGLSQSRMWSAGTLCITIAANIADTAILGIDACFPDSVVGFVPSREIGSAEFFLYFIQTAKSRLEDFAPSTAQKNINLNNQWC
jgi:type I restriction enzyme S subunit